VAWRSRETPASDLPKVVILKVLKVLCFVNLSQVFIPNEFLAKIDV